MPRKAPPRSPTAAGARRGTPTDVVLGYDDILSYESGNCCYGAVVGRYANRMRAGCFFLDGREYWLPMNCEETNHLHGVFPRQIFRSATDGDALLLRYLSPDQEEGFPGNLSLEVRYRLRDDNALEIAYTAVTDEPAIQFYCANFIQLDPVPHGKNGVRYPRNGGFCMEARHFPDSVHHRHFPSTILRPDETYRQTTVYRFTTFE